MTSEERLRAALRHGTPRPLDAPTIIAAAKRRRTMERARFTAVAAALVLVAGFGLALIVQAIIGAAGRQAIVQDPEPSAASAPPRAEQGALSTDNPDVIPGRQLVVQPQRWCLVRSGDARVIKCAPRTQRLMRVPDETNREWAVLLAPSGPQTAVLQAEQRVGWVSLRTSPVSGSSSLWLGVVPSEDLAEEPRSLRGLNPDGREIWAG